MIIEVRIYKTKPGKREAFIELFEARIKQSQEEVGIKILGQFRSLEDEDTFIWLRAYENEEKRKEQLEAFYQGDSWQLELRELALPMLEDYSNVHLVEPTTASTIQ